MLAGVRKRMELKNKRAADVHLAGGVARTCALCLGVFRDEDADADAAARPAVCRGCRAEAVLLAGRGDPRAEA